MQGPFLRKYGVEATVDFQLFEADGVDFRTDAVHAAGDSKVMKDEGAEANTSNGFTDEGQGYSITLTAAEMQAARIVVYFVDQTATKVWLDTAIVIETYGNASAMHAFDLDTATQDANVASMDAGTVTAAAVATGAIDADALAADAVDEILDEVIEGAVTMRQALRVFLSALGGKSTGGGTTTVTFRDNADSKARITATVDSGGNRTAVTLDGS